MILLVSVIVLILAFCSSESLATAYGISVTGAMVVTAPMSFQFLRSVWGFKAVTAALLLAPLLAIESVLMMANMLKVHDGGWVPLVLAAIIMMMWTWTKGSRFLWTKIAKNDIPLAAFIGSLESSIDRASDSAPVTVPGTAVFMKSVQNMTPGASVMISSITTFFTSRTSFSPSQGGTSLTCPKPNACI